MGQKAGCVPQVAAESEHAVTLNIYDVGGSKAVQEANKLFRTLGTGAFHAAVEIYGKEWSYGFCEEGTGVFSCLPRSCEQHAYRESLAMGETDISQADLPHIIEHISKEWIGEDYDLLRKNCCHFAAALVKEFHVGPVPTWVTNLAGAGATIDKGFQEAVVGAGKTVDLAKGAAIIAAAKAGEIDEKYNVKSTVQAKARDLLVKAGELDGQWGLTTAFAKFAKDLQGKAQLLSCNAGKAASGEAIEPHHPSHA